ncbi:MAG: hypothetical protein JO243_09685 [Solirubrobacterales bacterium]|nr:hypothetical protein [Solirubrobacterales bacterium]
MLTLILVALTVVLATCAICLAVRRWRTPPDLRGDWWPEFEREFRAYASRGGDRGRGRRHHRGAPA